MTFDERNVWVSLYFRLKSDEKEVMFYIKEIKIILEA